MAYRPTDEGARKKQLIRRAAAAQEAFLAEIAMIEEEWGGGMRLPIGQIIAPEHSLKFTEDCARRELAVLATRDLYAKPSVVQVWRDWVDKVGSLDPRRRDELRHEYIRFCNRADRDRAAQRRELGRVDDENFDRTQA